MACDRPVPRSFADTFTTPSLSRSKVDLDSAATRAALGGMPTQLEAAAAYLVVGGHLALASAARARARRSGLSSVV
jgi:hypothetical protein